MHTYSSRGTLIKNLTYYTCNSQLNIFAVPCYDVANSTWTGAKFLEPVKLRLLLGFFSGRATSLSLTSCSCSKIWELAIWMYNSYAVPRSLNVVSLQYRQQLVMLTCLKILKCLQNLQDPKEISSCYIWNIGSGVKKWEHSEPSTRNSLANYQISGRGRKLQN